MTQQTDDCQTAARKLFCTDLETEIKPYLKQMQEHVKTLCEQHGFIYPVDKPGRGFTGLRPNISYAVHFMIKGFNPYEAAYKYMIEQAGKAVKPQPLIKAKFPGAV